MYFTIKFAHIIFAVISGLLFAVRGYWMVRGSAQLQKPWVRLVPHVNDTLLLACAIALAVLSSQFPFHQDWLTVKVLGLIVYIILGTIALKRGKTKAIRVTALAAAAVVFAFIFSVARSRSPMGFLAGL